MSSWHSLPVAVCQGLIAPPPSVLPCIRNHQVVVDADHAAEAAAGVAGTQRRVEGEVAGQRILVGDVAVGAVQAGGIAPGARARGPRRRAHAPPAGRGRRAARASSASLTRPGSALPSAQAILDHREAVIALAGRLRRSARSPAPRACGLQFLLGQVRSAACTWKHTSSRGSPSAAARSRSDARMEAGVSRRTGLAAAAAMQRAGARVQQLQVIVDLGHRADRGARGAHRIGLVDGDGRRNALDAVDLRRDPCGRGTAARRARRSRCSGAGPPRTACRRPARTCPSRRRR